MSVESQHTMPTEVIIADDGSTDETAVLVKQFQKNFPVPLHHVWHEDKGFRLAAIRNCGFAKASTDYIIQIDGDLILHPKFIADHLDIRKHGYFVTGSRVLLSEESTRQLINNRSTDLKKWAGSSNNIINGVRSKVLRHLMATRYKIKGRHKYYVKGCNMAFWKSDLLTVNGYNEAFTGWGKEDSEIAIRLMNAGVKKQFIKMGGVCFHLHHRMASRELEEQNVVMMEAAVRDRLIRAKDGLDKYLAL